MDFFFITLRKTLVSTLLVLFAFVFTYIPQSPVHTVPVAEAGGGVTGGALETTQWLNRIILSSSLTQETITASTLVAGWTKENVLDGLGWSIAKMIASQMVQSTINWINSGFEGKPAFVQDIRGFLLDIGDQIAGDFISNIIVGDQSLDFICSPFRLDIAVALSARYTQTRDGQSDAPTCRLSDMRNNIQGFIDGIEGQAQNPGDTLRDWLTVTSAPKTYTPYGNLLETQANMRARIINAEGEEIGLLGFADGFLSKKLCDTVTDANGRTKEANCRVVLPGKAISESLNKALGAGTDTLIEADEIDEIINALFAQLATQALSGAAGLLGLSGGDGFGGYSSGATYLDQIVEEANSNLIGRAGTFNPIQESLDAERDLRDTAQIFRPAFVAFTTNPNRSLDDRRIAQRVVNDIDSRLERAAVTVPALEELLRRYNAASEEEQADINLEFIQSVNYLIEAQTTQIIGDWEDTASDLDIDL